MIVKAQATTTKIVNKSKLKTFKGVKGAIKKWKDNPQNGEKKKFSNHTSDKELISRTYRKWLQFNNNKTNSSIKIWAKALNRHFYNKEIHAYNSHLTKRLI